MNKIFASTLIIIYFAMSVVAHGLPHETKDGDSAKAVQIASCQAVIASTACIDQTDKQSKVSPLQCTSFHCSFHHIFLNQSSVIELIGLRLSQAMSADQLLLAMLPESEKKPPKAFA